MSLKVLPLHRHPEYMQECCKLINNEWKRSETARMRSLETSCDKLPTSLVLIDNDKVIGHCKLSIIPSLKEACFVESVVIDETLRGNGYGKHLMVQVEQYCRLRLNLKEIYLSTHGQEGFYQKLGYNECRPVSLYGGYCPVPERPSLACRFGHVNANVAPLPPPMPVQNPNRIVKTFMNKQL